MWIRHCLNIVNLAHQIPSLYLHCAFFCVNNFFKVLAYVQYHSVDKLFSQASSSGSQGSQDSSPKRKRESFIKEDNLQVTSPKIDICEDYAGRLERVSTRDRLAFIVVFLSNLDQIWSMG